MKFKSPDGKVFDNLETAVSYFCGHYGNPCYECPIAKFCRSVRYWTHYGRVCNFAVNRDLHGAGWLAKNAAPIAQLMGYEVIEDTAFKDNDLNPGDTSLLDEFLNELQVE